MLFLCVRLLLAGAVGRWGAGGVPFELDVTDEVVTVGEGALWNAQLAYTSERPYLGDGEVFGNLLYAHPSSGNGIHNPSLLRVLLPASIDAVLAKYFSEGPAAVSGRAGP